ncbi:palmitoyltransferase ZDHHC7 isoform X2 [Lontra canadensis]|uniref:palmitoyltransferase ZDHHC7 isoform X2 n=1 Tax=Lontra canadensis TaxID=76717 RepID=UPI0013F3745D|nr:palmitoyltransferase ZDHHC7 isoform X2 [Lontra canadensis]
MGSSMVIKVLCTKLLFSIMKKKQVNPVSEISPANGFRAFLSTQGFISALARARRGACTETHCDLSELRHFALNTQKIWAPNRGSGFRASAAADADPQGTYLRHSCRQASKAGGRLGNGPSLHTHVSHGGGAVSPPEGRARGGQTRHASRGRAACSFAHLLSGVDVCVRLQCEAFNMYTCLSIKTQSKRLNREACRCANPVSTSSSSASLFYETESLVTAPHSWASGASPPTSSASSLAATVTVPEPQMPLCCDEWRGRRALPPQTVPGPHLLSAPSWCVSSDLTWFEAFLSFL